MTDTAISPLRQRMIEDMEIRGFTAKTQTGYPFQSTDPYGTRFSEWASTDGDKALFPVNPLP